MEGLKRLGIPTILILLCLTVLPISADRAFPTAGLLADGEPIGRDSYTNAACISFISDGTCFVRMPESEAFVPYLSGTELFRAGRYEFYGVSESGAKTGVYAVVIDRTPKAVDLSGVTDGVAEGDVTVHWENGDAERCAPIKSVTVNGRLCGNGTVLRTLDGGSYAVSCMDGAGNVWSASFEARRPGQFGKTAPARFYETVDRSGTVFSFSGWEMALAFAKERERALVRDAVWNGGAWDAGLPMDAPDAENATPGRYWVYRKSDEPEELAAYFTEARLEAVILEYAQSTVQSFWYFEKIPAPPASGEAMSAFPSGQELICTTFDVAADYGLRINGRQTSERPITKEGTHLITVLDAWGNSRDVTVHLVRQVPTLQYRLAGGELHPATDRPVYRFGGAVFLSVSDAVDAFAAFEVFDASGKRVGVYGMDETCELSESGSYTVYTVNHYGRSEPIAIEVSVQPSRIGFDSADALEIRITESPDASPDRVEIAVSQDAGEHWTVLGQDADGKAVSASAGTYRFLQNGLYRVRVWDKYRTGTDSVEGRFSYRKVVRCDVPVCDGGFVNDLTITAEEPVTVQLLRDGQTVAYQVGDVISLPGEYELTVTDAIGNQLHRRFTVVPRLCSSFRGDFSAIKGLQSVTVNGEVQELHDGMLVLDADSSYTVTVQTAERTDSFQITVDATPPTLTLSGVENGGETGGTVLLSDPSEETELIVTKDGEAVAYRYGEPLTDAGVYHAILTDACGNQTEYRFVIIETADTSWVAFAVIAGILALGGVGLVLFRRRKLR